MNQQKLEQALRDIAQVLDAPTPPNQDEHDVWGRKIAAARTLAATTLKEIDDGRRSTKD